MAERKKHVTNARKILLPVESLPTYWVQKQEVMTTWHMLLYLYHILFLIILDALIAGSMHGKRALHPEMLNATNDTCIHQYAVTYCAVNNN